MPDEDALGRAAEDMRVVERAVAEAATTLTRDRDDAWERGWCLPGAPELQEDALVEQRMALLCDRLPPAARAALLRLCPRLSGEFSFATPVHLFVEEEVRDVLEEAAADA